MKKEILKNFLVDSEDTGRHIVKSIRTGRKYYVEPVFKYTMKPWECSLMPEYLAPGSVRMEESIVTKENGFDEVHFVDSGSPYEQINKLDEKYPDLIKK